MPQALFSRCSVNPNNAATAFRVHQGANNYFVISTVNGSEAMTFGTAEGRATRTDLIP